MQNYVGYGFDTNDIEKDDLLVFVEKFDQDKFQEMCQEVAGRPIRKIEDLTDDEKEELFASLDEWIEEPSYYIRDVINGSEIAEGRMKDEGVVDAYEEFVVFENIPFPECGYERCRRIRSESDFIGFIKGYFPNVDITFSKIWEGLEDSDPVLYMD